MQFHIGRLNTNSECHTYLPDSPNINWKQKWPFSFAFRQIRFGEVGFAVTQKRFGEAKFVVMQSRPRNTGFGWTQNRLSYLQYIFWLSERLMSWFDFSNAIWGCILVFNATPVLCWPVMAAVQVCRLIGSCKTWHNPNPVLCSVEATHPSSRPSLQKMTPHASISMDETAWLS